MILEEVQDWMAGLNEEQLWGLAEALILEFSTRDKYIAIYQGDKVTPG